MALSEAAEKLNKLVQLILGHLSHSDTVNYVPHIHLRKCSCTRLPDLLFKLAHV